MGNTFSLAAGHNLLDAAARGDHRAVQRELAAHPNLVSFARAMDRTSPLLAAAGSGHYRVVQAILEASVMSCTPERVSSVLNHANRKGQSALILACMHGHAQCVEYLILNGADPLVLDGTHHNTCLLWAAAHCHADCVSRLLRGRGTHQLQNGASCPVAEIPCWDEDGSTQVRFVDRRNASGLCALHAAALRGSTATAAALVRGGADVTIRTAAPRGGAGCPLPLPPGSTALHIAALQGDLLMVRLLLEAQQDGRGAGGRDLRAVANSAGEIPLDCVRATRNIVLLHLLDDRLPMSSTRQLLARVPLGGFPAAAALALGAAGERERERQHAAGRGEELASLLQRLRLLLALEVVGVERALAGVDDARPRTPREKKAPAAPVPPPPAACVEAAAARGKRALLPEPPAAGASGGGGAATAGGDAPRGGAADQARPRGAGASAPTAWAPPAAAGAAGGGGRILAGLAAPLAGDGAAAAAAGSLGLDDPLAEATDTDDDDAAGDGGTRGAQRGTGRRADRATGAGAGAAARRAAGGAGEEDEEEEEMLTASEDYPTDEQDEGESEEPAGPDAKEAAAPPRRLTECEAAALAVRLGVLRSLLAEVEGALDLLKDSAGAAAADGAGGGSGGSRRRRPQTIAGLVGMIASPRTVGALGQASKAFIAASALGKDGAGGGGAAAASSAAGGGAGLAGLGANWSAQEQALHMLRASMRDVRATLAAAGDALSAGMDPSRARRLLAAQQQMQIQQGQQRAAAAAAAAAAAPAPAGMAFAPVLVPAPAAGQAGALGGRELARAYVYLTSPEPEAGGGAAGAGAGPSAAGLPQLQPRPRGAGIRGLSGAPHGGGGGGSAPAASPLQLAPRRPGGRPAGREREQERERERARRGRRREQRRAQLLWVDHSPGWPGVAAADADAAAEEPEAHLSSRMHPLADAAQAPTQAIQESDVAATGTPAAPLAQPESLSTSPQRLLALDTEAPSRSRQPWAPAGGAAGGDGAAARPAALPSLGRESPIGLSPPAGPAGPPPAPEATRPPAAAGPSRHPEIWAAEEGPAAGEVGGDEEDGASSFGTAGGGEAGGEGEGDDSRSEFAAASPRRAALRRQGSQGSIDGAWSIQATGGEGAGASGAAAATVVALAAPAGSSDKSSVGAAPAAIVGYCGGYLGSDYDNGSDDDDDDDDDDANMCAICMDRWVGVSFTGCAHSMCVACAFQLCGKGKGMPLCPFCRDPIAGFQAAAASL